MSRARDLASSGVTSTVLSAKAPLASPDFTGTVDLTGTTVNLDNDQISGDKVSGGTIGAGTFDGTLGSSANFASIANDAIPIAKLASDAITIAGSSTALGGSISAETIINAVSSGSLVTTGRQTSVYGSVTMNIGGESSGTITIPNRGVGSLYYFYTSNNSIAGGWALIYTNSSTGITIRKTDLAFTAITSTNASAGTFKLTNQNGGVGVYTYHYSLIKVK